LTELFVFFLLFFLLTVVVDGSAAIAAWDAAYCIGDMTGVTAPTRRGRASANREGKSTRVTP
jgi:hypothetical protein